MGKEKKRKKEKVMLFLVATNVVASRPPKRQLTGTPTARADPNVDRLYQFREKN